jgi:hypothetical protein
MYKCSGYLFRLCTASLNSRARQNVHADSRRPREREDGVTKDEIWKMLTGKQFTSSLYFYFYYYKNKK